MKELPFSRSVFGKCYLTVGRKCSYLRLHIHIKDEFYYGLTKDLSVSILFFKTVHFVPHLCLRENDSYYKYVHFNKLVKIKIPGQCK